MPSEKNVRETTARELSIAVTTAFVNNDGQAVDAMFAAIGDFVGVEPMTPQDDALLTYVAAAALMSKTCVGVAADRAGISVQDMMTIAGETLMSIPIADD